LTGRAAGGPDPGTGTPTRTIRTRDAAGAIIVVLAAGLALRLIIAQLLPGSGFASDLASFRAWSADLFENGLAGFYERISFIDYTPGYLYVLWLVGWLDSVIPGPMDDLIKIPAILADVVLGWLVASMVLELGGGRRSAVLAAGVVVLNPITWFDSVVWGQVDSFGVIFLLLGVRELWRDRTERAAFFAVLAAIVKPQLGILAFLVAAVTIRRAIWPPGGEAGLQYPALQDASSPRGLLSRLASFEGSIRGPVRVLTTGLVGLVTAIVLSAPFGLSLFGLFGQVGKAAGGYPYLTVNAYNPWALVTLGSGDQRSGLAHNGTWVCDAPSPDCTTFFAIAGIPAAIIGTALILVAIVAVSAVVARRPDRLTILVGLAVLSLAFFVLPTRVHERYLFPFYVVSAVLFAVSVRWRVGYALLAAATFANMYVVLTSIYPDNPQISDWLGWGRAIRDSVGVTLVALVHLAGLAWAATELRGAAIGRLGREVTAHAEPPPRTADHARTQLGRRRPVPEWGPPGTIPQPAPAGALSPSVARIATAPTSAADLGLPTWTERPSIREVGPWEWFRSRLFDRPIRPDRSRELDHEPGGRLDRLDLWIVAVLLLSVLGLRVWRLAEPYQMHFDEVYHARTAQEFLQYWRYGISHDIYEWTHPHLAKYAIAGGIVAWGDDRVSATAELGVPVSDAVVEPRYEDLATGERSGERLWVATGEDVRAYDLNSRGLVGAIPMAGAARLALDETGHVLIAGTADGSVLTIDLVGGAPDVDASVIATGEPVLLAEVGEPIETLHVTDDGATVAAATATGRVVMIDAVNGAVAGEISLPTVAALVDAGTSPVVEATVAEVDDPDAVAAVLADLLAEEEPDRIRTRMAEAIERQDVSVVLAAVTRGDEQDDVQAAIDDGTLTGIGIADRPRVAVAEGGGLTFLVPQAGDVSSRTALTGGARGLTLINVNDKPQLYVSTGTPDDPGVAVVAVGTGEGDTPTYERTLPMPGPVTTVVFDDPSQQVHVLGRTPDGAGSTIYVLDPHGNAVYADARLPFEPTALALDANGQYPTDDRQQLLAFETDGSVATVEVGKHAFGWRLPGVIAGAIMAALLYVLARILFRRRSVGVAVGLLTLLDGMFFVQSRIAMNDAYVGVFILAAYTLFAAIWTNAWRWRGAFWVVMPVIGLCLGLALSAKWVAAYAIGALGILVLARSALGRVVLIGGLILGTTVLGYIALSVPPDTKPEAGWQILPGVVLQGNLTFVLIMIGLCLVATAAAVLHPIAWSTDEIRFAIGAPAAAGVALALVSLALGRLDRDLPLVGATAMEVAFALALLSIAVAATLWVVGRFGIGPLAPPAGPDDPARYLEPPSPPRSGWLRPGWALGIPVAWVAACLIVLPLAVYVASYVPWSFMQNHVIVDGWPVAREGDTQTLIELTGRMYDYHNTLGEGHPASSPWWAWPFNLKPVWFYQESFAGNTAAAIYDAGNLASWWLGVPAMAFVAWQAYRRRSIALALIAIGFACQWIAWARIDRAAFQYHYYTGLPFVLLGLAYFLAELWHGASNRTWLLARMAAAAAIVAPAAMWLLHRPLCGYVRVEAANPGTQACPTLIPEFVLTPRTGLLAVAVGIGVLVVLRQLMRLEPAGVDDRRSDGGPGGVGAFVPLVGIAGAAVVVIGLLAVVPDGGALVRLQNLWVEPIALVVGLPFAAIAAFVATARDARRFVAGVLLAVAATFVVWYPNLAALPLPATIFNAYQGVLPTYLYPFQFPVSLVNRSGPLPDLIAFGPAVFLVALTVTCLVIAYSAGVWRLALAERRLDEAEAAAGAGLARSGGPA
jgi:predicted membrane-bound dolichyl-phosphate-mannose-protein mannosyltransferase